MKVTEIERLLLQLESKLTNKFNDSLETLSSSNSTSFVTRLDDISFKISLVSSRMDQTSSRLSLLTHKINEILKYLLEKENEEENDENNDSYLPLLPPTLLPLLPEDGGKKEEENVKSIDTPKKLNIGGRRKKRLTEDRLEEILLTKLEMLKGEVRRELNQKIEMMEEIVGKKMEEVGKKVSEEGKKQKEVNKEVEGWRRSSIVVTQNTREKLETLEDGWIKIREGIEEDCKKTEGRVNDIEEACYKKEETDKRVEMIRREVEGIEERVRQMMEGYGKGGGDAAGIFTKIKWNCASCDKQVDSLKGNLTDFRNWAIFPPKETFPARLIGKMGNPRKKIDALMEKTSLPVLSFDGGIRTMTDSFKDKNSKLKPMKF